MGSKSNSKYIKGYPKKYLMQTGDMLPSGKAIAWLMIATGIHRIFNKNDMEEFLFRIAIILDYNKLMESWILNSQILEFKSKNATHTLCLEDIIIHFGYEEDEDAIENFMPRSLYFKQIASLVKGAMIIGSFEDCSIIEPMYDEEDFWKTTLIYNAPKITEELIENANLFAQDAIKHIPNKIFSNKDNVLKSKELEIKKRKENC